VEIIAAIVLLVLMLLIELPHFLKKRGVLENHKKIDIFYLILLSIPVFILCYAFYNYLLD
jgi:hypothetical protein